MGFGRGVSGLMQAPHPAFGHLLPKGEGIDIVPWRHASSLDALIQTINAVKPGGMTARLNIVIDAMT